MSQSTKEACACQGNGWVTHCFKGAGGVRALLAGGFHQRLEARHLSKCGFALRFLLLQRLWTVLTIKRTRCTQ